VGRQMEAVTGRGESSLEHCMTSHEKTCAPCVKEQRDPMHRWINVACKKSSCMGRRRILSVGDYAENRRTKRNGEGEKLKGEKVKGGQGGAGKEGVVGWGHFCVRPVSIFQVWGRWEWWM
jgi:hypothetical protein